MKPPTGGPSTGPSSAGMVSQAIAGTSSALATVRSSTQAADRHHHGAAHALQDAREPNPAASLSDAAEDRAEREDDDRGAEDVARAETVGDPAAGRDEHREAEQVRGHRHIHPHRIVAECLRHGRQRGGDHVESRFSMNIAQATISAVSRLR